MSESHFGRGSSEACSPDRQASTWSPSPRASPPNPQQAPDGPSEGSADGQSHLGHKGTFLAGEGRREAKAWRRGDAIREGPGGICGDIWEAKLLKSALLGTASMTGDLKLQTIGKSVSF